MQNMINTGQFGSTGPQPGGFNPYTQMQNNGYNYQPTNYGYYPQYQQPQYGNNDFVFKPLDYSYAGYNAQPQQQQTSYFNPYGAYGPSYGYNGYGQNGYYNNYRDPMYSSTNTYGYPNQGYGGGYGYGGYMSPMQQKRQMDEYVRMMTLKHSVVDAYFCKETNPQEIAKKYNPQLSKPSIEEIQQREETKFINYVSYLATQPRIYDSVMQERDFIIAMSANNHKEFDNHSLFQFLNDDMWKIEREAWIRENVVPRQNRNLSAMYNSADYNELLNLHRSSNPYISSLLDTSRYDNNIDDIEMGMNLALDKARRRKAILEGKVPDFISSPEVQDRRNKFLNTVLENMYKKNGGGP